MKIYIIKPHGNIPFKWVSVGYYRDNSTSLESIAHLCIDKEISKRRLDGVPRFLCFSACIFDRMRI